MQLVEQVHVSQVFDDILHGDLQGRLLDFSANGSLSSVGGGRQVFAGRLRVRRVRGSHCLRSYVTVHEDVYEVVVVKHAVALRLVWCWLSC